MPDMVKTEISDRNVYDNVADKLEALAREFDGVSAGGFSLLTDFAALARFKAVYRRGIVDRNERRVAGEIIECAESTFARVHSY